MAHGLYFTLHLVLKGEVLRCGPWGYEGFPAVVMRPHALQGLSMQGVSRTVVVELMYRAAIPNIQTWFLGMGYQGTVHSSYTMNVSVQCWQMCRVPMADVLCWCKHQHETHSPFP